MNQSSQTSSNSDTARLWQEMNVLKSNISGQLQEQAASIREYKEKLQEQATAIEEYKEKLQEQATAIEEHKQTLTSLLLEVENLKDGMANIKTECKTPTEDRRLSTGCIEGQEDSLIFLGAALRQTRPSVILITIAAICTVLALGNV